MAVQQAANADFLANALVSLDINAPPQFNEDEFSIAFNHIHVGNAPDPSLPTRLVGPNGRYHELQFDYPALNLLHKGYETFVIHEPKEIIFREQPRLKKFHLRPESLSFYTKLDTPLSVGHSFLLPAELGAIEYFDTILSLVQRLSCSPGVSNLEVLQFTFGGTERIRFRLNTTWILATGESLRECKTYEYTALEWQRYRALSRGVRWIQILNNLIDRASDRAYLAVREKMMKADPKLVESDDSFIEKKWMMYDIGSPNIVLFRRLVNFPKQVIEETGWGGKEQQHSIELECGHRMTLSLFYVLHRMSEDDVKSFSCSFCGEGVLTGRHLRRIEIAHDLQKRAIFLRNEPLWPHLEARFTGNTFSIPVADLVAALKQGLDMLNVPESVSPPELNPANAPETRSILNSLATVFGQNYFVVNAALHSKVQIRHIDTRCLLLINAVRVLRWHSGLVGATIPELKRVLPPLYFQFLIRWFTRAILLCAAKVAQQSAKVAEEMNRMKM